MSFYQYKDPHVKDKTQSLYWDGALAHWDHHPLEQLIQGDCPLHLVQRITMDLEVSTAVHSLPSAAQDHFLFPSNIFYNHIEIVCVTCLNILKMGVWMGAVKSLDIEHCLVLSKNQWWPRSMTPYDFTWLQWISILKCNARTCGLFWLKKICLLTSIVIFYYKDKTVSQQSYIHNGNSHTMKKGLDNEMGFDSTLKSITNIWRPSH